MIKKLRAWARARLRWINIGLAAAAYVANEYWLQGFCQPVLWAKCSLGITTLAFLLWPWLRGKSQALEYALLWLQGIALVECVYCAWFIAPELPAATFLFFLILPLLAWVPVLFAVQILLRVPTAAGSKGQLGFWLGVLTPLVALGWAQWQYQAVETAVAQLPRAQRQQIPALLRVVPRTYMAERLAGAYFKYHNYPEFVYDGWRPPLHDPLVNVCLWLHSISAGPNNPLKMLTYQAYAPYYAGFYLSLNKQVELYQQLFPRLPVKADCVCSQNDDGRSYRDWVPGTDSY
jgi:hypothetical protein